MYLTENERYNFGPHISSVLSSLDQAAMLVGTHDYRAMDRSAWSPSLAMLIKWVGFKQQPIYLTIATLVISANPSSLHVV